MKQENLEKIIAFRHVLHEHPELSNHEVITRKLIKEFIAQNMSSYLVFDEGDWLYCMKPYQPTKKTIVLRADHDAIMNSSNTASSFSLAARNVKQISPFAGEMPKFKLPTFTWIIVIIASELKCLFANVNG